MSQTVPNWLSHLTKGPINPKLRERCIKCGMPPELDDSALIDWLQQPSPYLCDSGDNYESVYFDGLKYTREGAQTAHKRAIENGLVAPPMLEWNRL